MDQEGVDIAGTKARMPAQPIPDITQEVLKSSLERETGFRSRKTVTVAPVLKACAEDELVKKEYKEMVNILLLNYENNIVLFRRNRQNIGIPN